MSFYVPILFKAGIYKLNRPMQKQQHTHTQTHTHTQIHKKKEYKKKEKIMRSGGDNRKNSEIVWQKPKSDTNNKTRSSLGDGCEI
jgi:hypothetical protein